MPSTARIALNRPLRRLFDYIVPAGLVLQPGQRVKIPFGRQQAIGLVVETNIIPPEGITLKPVYSALEEWPALPKETFQLLSWASDYYQHPLGECLFTALPPHCGAAGRPSQKAKTGGQPAAAARHCLQTPINKKICWTGLHSTHWGQKAATLLEQASPVRS